MPSKRLEKQCNIPLSTLLTPVLNFRRIKYGHRSFRGSPYPLVLEEVVCSGGRPHAGKGASWNRVGEIPSTHGEHREGHRLEVLHLRSWLLLVQDHLQGNNLKNEINIFFKMVSWQYLLNVTHINFTNLKTIRCGENDTAFFWNITNKIILASYAKKIFKYIKTKICFYSSKICIFHGAFNSI